MSSVCNNKQLTVGIDVGTSSIKIAVMKSHAGENAELITSSATSIRRRNVRQVVRDAFIDACAAAKVNQDAICYLASTGDGEAVPFRSGHFYSMTAHSKGAIYLLPQTRAVLDIGALHARAIRIDEKGRVLSQRMTNQCASGSGQFLENIARYLGVPLEDVGTLSASAKAPETVSSICAVLAETDVINMVSRGISTADILKGIHLSITGRLLRLLRAISAEGTVLVTGGLSKDKGMLQAFFDQLELETKKRSRRPKATLDFMSREEGMMAGAYGAALLAAFRYIQLKKLGKLSQVSISVS